jgi:F-type H+-transporting ATPase subunit delta
LSAAIGKEIVPHVRADPRILGGIIVRVGDRVMDGSLRRKLMLLRRHMLGA